jgi:hypothetical protein
VEFWGEKMFLVSKRRFLTQRREGAEAQKGKEEGERVKKMRSEKWDMKELPKWLQGFGREGALGLLEVPADR